MAHTFAEVVERMRLMQEALDRGCVTQLRAVKRFDLPPPKDEDFELKAYPMPLEPAKVEPSLCACGAHFRAKDLARRRREYIRQHAPTILASMPPDGSLRFDATSWQYRREEAIEQAGLLFDETEREEAKP